MESSSTKKIIVLILLAVLVIVAAYLLANNAQNTKTGNNTDTGTGKTVKAEVSYVDLDKATDEEDKLPAGFPSDVPVESDGILESYVGSLPNSTIKIATVVYLSDNTPDEKYTEYLKYMTDSGYTFSTDGKRAPSGQTGGSLYGTKNNNDLSFSITKTEAGSRIHINYMMR